MFYGPTLQSQVECLANFKGQFIPIPIGYHETIITPHASRSVGAFWSYTAEQSGHSLILPDGRCDVIFRYNINNATAPVPVLTGPATRPYHVEYSSGDCWLGLRLRPENGALVWARDISRAADTVLRGPQVIVLLPALSHLNRNGVTLDDVNDALEPTLRRPPDNRLTYGLSLLHTTGGRMKIESLAKHIGITARHLNRLFQSNVGLPVKTYSQLVQFHRGMRLIQQGGLPIAAAAYEAGYADHAHLTRAFRRFGGFSPTQIPSDLSVPLLFNQ